MPSSSAISLQSLVEEVRELQVAQNSYVYRALGQWLVMVLLNNRRYTPEVCDVGYDRSTRAVAISEGFCMEDYGCVADLLDNEYTGRTVATYYSGAGLAAQTLREEASEIALEALTDWLRLREPKTLDSFEDSELGFSSDEMWDALSEIGSEGAFVHNFETRRVQDVWDEYLADAVDIRAKQREAEEAQLLALQRKNAYIEAHGRAMLTSLNTRWLGRRFEKASSTELWEVLAEQAALGREQQVASALCLSPRLFHLSNSVLAQAMAKYPVTFV
jgi:hypothetical protein